MGLICSKKKDKFIQDDIIHSKPYVRDQTIIRRSMDLEYNKLDKYDNNSHIKLLKYIHWKVSCSPLLVSKVSDLDINDLYNDQGIRNGNLVEYKIIKMVPIKNLDNNDFNEYLKILNESMKNNLLMNDDDINTFIDKIKEYRKHRSNP